jgi:hypothetical protein
MGGAGFIGSAAPRHLVGAGHEALNADKLTHDGNLASLRPIENQPDHRFARGDWSKLGADGCDHFRVLHVSTGEPSTLMAAPSSAARTRPAPPARALRSCARAGSMTDRLAVAETMVSDKDRNAPLFADAFPA